MRGGEEEEERRKGQVLNKDKEALTCQEITLRRKSRDSARRLQQVQLPAFDSAFDSLLSLVIPPA